MKELLRKDDEIELLQIDYIHDSHLQSRFVVVLRPRKTVCEIAAILNEFQ